MTTEERLENLERKLAEAEMATAPKEIRANRFVLEDGNGKVCASLGVVKGGTGLVLADENGEPRASLGVGKDGPALNLFNENDEIRASL
ncbi:MAG: hypothetical protein U9R68_09325, partial [Planctomycetota bacterium]|nr:hypothetical protein [Planctomycetota bacterium]